MLIHCKFCLFLKVVCWSIGSSLDIICWTKECSWWLNQNLRVVVRIKYSHKEFSLLISAARHIRHIDEMLIHWSKILQWQKLITLTMENTMENRVLHFPLFSVPDVRSLGSCVQIWHGTWHMIHGTYFLYWCWLVWSQL